MYKIPVSEPTVKKLWFIQTYEGLKTPEQAINYILEMYFQKG
jgi:hypothetical protein